jgi:hypothetical protein
MITNGITGSNDLLLSLWNGDIDMTTRIFAGLVLLSTILCIVFGSVAIFSEKNTEWCEIFTVICAILTWIFMLMAELLKS